MPESQRHILCVNNDEAVLQVFRELLGEEGYRVTTQRFVIKDLKAIRTDPPDPPDLVVLDYMWAEEDGGWSMLQVPRMDRATAKTPIMLCTGAKDRVAELGDRLAQQDVRVVFKPFDIDELLGVIARTLAHRE